MVSVQQAGEDPLVVRSSWKAVKFGKEHREVEERTKKTANQLQWLKFAARMMQREEPSIYELWWRSTSLERFGKNGGGEESTRNEGRGRAGDFHEAERGHCEDGGRRATKYTFTRGEVSCVEHKLLALRYKCEEEHCD